MKIQMLIPAVLVSFVTAVGCSKMDSAINATSDMPDKIDATNDKLSQMGNTVSQQPVEIAVQAMLDPANGVALNPIPFDIMPYAQTFGQYATTDEIVQLVYLWVQKLTMRGIGVTSPSADQIAAFNQQQTQAYYALESVCGMLPDAKAQQIVQEQIDGQGRFQDTAMQLLMLRVRFLRDVMIGASLLSAPIDNVGKLEYGVNYANSIDYVARLPYAAQISVNLPDFMAPLAPISETLDPKGVALGMWTEIQSAIQFPATSNGSSNLTPDLAARKAAALATIAAKIKSWGGTP